MVYAAIHVVARVWHFKDLTVGTRYPGTIQTHLVEQNRKILHSNDFPYVVTFPSGNISSLKTTQFLLLDHVYRIAAKYKAHKKLYNTLQVFIDNTIASQYM